MSMAGRWWNTTSRTTIGTIPAWRRRWRRRANTSCWATTAILRATAARGAGCRETRFTGKRVRLLAAGQDGPVEIASPAQQPQHQHKRQAEQDAGGEGKIETEVTPVDPDIARQPAEVERQPSGEGHEQSGGQQHQTHRD